MDHATLLHALVRAGELCVSEFALVGMAAQAISKLLRWLADRVEPEQPRV